LLLILLEQTSHKYLIELLGRLNGSKWVRWRWAGRT